MNLEEMAETMIQASQEGDRRTTAESIPPAPYSHSIQLGGMHSCTEHVLIKPPNLCFSHCVKAGYTEVNKQMWYLPCSVLGPVRETASDQDQKSSVTVLG